MAVLKGIAANTQGKPLEAYLPLPESKKEEVKLGKEDQPQLPEAIEIKEQLRKYQEVISHQERKRQEDLGILGRLKERTWEQAVILSCNTAEGIALVGLSIATIIGYAATLGQAFKLIDAQVAGIQWIQKKFDQICPGGSILSGGKPLLDSNSFGGYLFGAVKLGFGIITYPTTLVLNTALGTLTSGIEEVDRNIFKKGIPYSKYLKDVEENPSTVRDSLNLLCFVVLSFLTAGKLRTPLPMALRSQKALQLMIPSLGMGAAGALGEQLMRVEDEDKGGFRKRVLLSDMISGALSSGIFMGGMKVGPKWYRGFADVSDGGDDFVDASAEYGRIEAGSKKISVIAKLARTAGYGLKVGTAVYDLGDTKVLNKIEQKQVMGSLETQTSLQADFQTQAKKLQRSVVSNVSELSDSGTTDIVQVQKSLQTIIDTMLQINTGFSEAEGAAFKRAQSIIINLLISDPEIKENESIIVQSCLENPLLRSNIKLFLIKSLDTEARLIDFTENPPTPSSDNWLNKLGILYPKFAAEVITDYLDRNFSELKTFKDNPPYANLTAKRAAYMLNHLYSFSDNLKQQLNGNGSLVEKIPQIINFLSTVNTNKEAKDIFARSLLLMLVNSSDTPNNSNPTLQLGEAVMLYRAKYKKDFEVLYEVLSEKTQHELVNMQFHGHQPLKGIKLAEMLGFYLNNSMIKPSIDGYYAAKENGYATRLSDLKNKLNGKELEIDAEDRQEVLDFFEIACAMTERGYPDMAFQNAFIGFLSQIDPPQLNATNVLHHILADESFRDRFKRNFSFLLEHNHAERENFRATSRSFANKLTNLLKVRNLDLIQDTWDYTIERISRAGIDNFNGETAVAQAERILSLVVESDSQLNYPILNEKGLCLQSEESIAALISLTQKMFLDSLDKQDAELAQKVISLLRNDYLIPKQHPLLLVAVENMIIKVLLSDQLDPIEFPRDLIKCLKEIKGVNAKRAVAKALPYIIGEPVIEQILEETFGVFAIEEICLEALSYYSSLEVQPNLEFNTAAVQFLTEYLRNLLSFERPINNPHGYLGKFPLKRMTSDAAVKEHFQNLSRRLIETQIHLHQFISEHFSLLGSQARDLIKLRTRCFDVLQTYLKIAAQNGDGKFIAEVIEDLLKPFVDSDDLILQEYAERVRQEEAA